MLESGLPARRAVRSVSVPLAELPTAAVLAWLRLRDILRGLLGGDLVAVWGYGARAFADPPRGLGDIDTWVVVAREPDAATAARIQEAREAVGRDATANLDVSIVLEADAARPELPRDVVRPERRYEAWAFHRAHWLAGRYVQVHGKRPEEIVPAPAWSEIERAMRLELDHLERHVAAGDDRDLYEASYALLNGSRILRDLATRDVVVSKRAAAMWALEHLPQRWHDAIRAATRAYDGEATPEDAEVLRAAMPSFVALVRENLVRAAQQREGEITDEGHHEARDNPHGTAPGRTHGDS